MNKKFWLRLPVVILAFGLVLAGCPQTPDESEGGGGTGGGGGVPEAVQNLTSFEGTFVANETEAVLLATGADAQIQTAIAAALSQQALLNINPNITALFAFGESGHYEHNGIILDYTVTGSPMDGTYPSSFNIKQVVKINGVYEGYKVNGHYNLTLDYTYTDESNYSILYDYDCTYTVSYNGKGMKVIATGKMTMALPDYTYDMHYAVYDNDNTLKYNYNYKSSP